MQANAAHHADAFAANQVCPHMTCLTRVGTYRVRCSEPCVHAVAVACHAAPMCWLWVLWCTTRYWRHGPSASGVCLERSPRDAEERGEMLGAARRDTAAAKLAASR